MKAKESATKIFHRGPGQILCPVFPADMQANHQRKVRAEHDRAREGLRGSYSPSLLEQTGEHIPRPRVMGNK